MKKFHLPAMLVLLFVMAMAVMPAAAQTTAQTTVMFIRNGDVVKANVATGEVINITGWFRTTYAIPNMPREFSALSVSADGTRIAAILTNANTTEVDGDLVVFNSDGSLVADLAECHDTVYNCTHPMLSPDGRYVVYTAVRVSDGRMFLRARDLSDLTIPYRAIHSGVYSPANPATRWLGNERFALIGRFISGQTSDSRRIYNIATGSGYNTDNDVTAPQTQPLVGCNGETFVSRLNATPAITDVLRNGSVVASINGVTPDDLVVVCPNAIVPQATPTNP